MIAPGLLLCQSADVRADGGAGGFEVVAAFEAGDEASAARLARPFHDRARHGNEVFVFEAELAERVAAVRVEAGREDDEVGLELRADLFERGLDDAAVPGRARARAQRAV